jgi:hypothetical protein
MFKTILRRAMLAITVAVLMLTGQQVLALDCNQCPGGWDAADEACAGLSSDSCATDCFSDCEPNCSQPELQDNSGNGNITHFMPSKDRNGFTVAKPAEKTDAKVKR